MATTARITRDDIEAKLREISGEVDEKVETAKPVLLAGAVGAVLAVAVIAYLLGRRGGRKRSALVEIRRI
jgi:hypothetical protein